MANSVPRTPPRRALLLLFSVLLAVCTLLPLTTARVQTVSRAAPAGRSPGAPVTAKDDSDEDDDDDDDDGWDFLSDSAVLAASDALKESERRRVTCAMSLDASYVNDDYCDCADGSDEPLTGACGVAPEAAHAHFQCKSLDAQRIPASFVGDGVCDCCDGSDESSGVCEDVCGSKRLARLEHLRSRLRLVERARGIQAAYASAARARIDGIRDAFDEIASTATALQRAFQYRQEALQTAAQESGREPSQRQIQELQYMYHQLNQWQFTAYVYSKIVQPEVFDEEHGREAFSALVGDCFPLTVNEKQLKGGSSNVVPREYVMMFCPFQNVTQTEPSYAQWQRVERQAKLGVDAAAHAEDGEPEATQEPIIMGVWDHWTKIPADEKQDFAEASAVVFRQRYEHGEQCANGQKRVVNVDVLCGDKNRVLSVEEPEMCVYSLQFETPAACLSKQEDAVEASITSLEALIAAAEKHEEQSVGAAHEEL